MSSQAAGKAPLHASSAVLFARNFLKYPAMLGSVIPSSRFLVNDLLNQIDWDRARVLVEYGPGVGTITREMLKRMSHEATLVVIETNHEFVDFLGDTLRDPRLRVIHGSAVDVRRILAEHGLAPADCIISSIPYSFMSDSLRRQILTESRHALKQRGSMLVFQYTRTILPYLQSCFSSVRQGFQMFNILPARIFHCTP